MKNIIILFLLFGCVPPDSIVNYDTEKATNTIKETELFNGVNTYRNSLWLPKLRTDEFARILAEKHNLEMIRYDSISHNNFPLRLQILTNKGAISVGEIVGYGYCTTEGILNAFKNSQSHNSILIGSFNYVGISIIDDYYTLIFIRI